MTKFCYWLKNNVGKEKITEWSASEYLEGLRREQGCLDSSFDTISAWGPNAAMMHYAPSEENEVVLPKEGFLLVDSGGHYLDELIQLLLPDQQRHFAQPEPVYGAGNAGGRVQL